MAIDIFGSFFRGRIVNEYQSEPFTDKTTGEVTPGKFKVSVFFHIPLSSGGVRSDIKDFVCEKGQFSGLENKIVEFPYQEFSPANSNVIYSKVFPGVKPTVLG